MTYWDIFYKWADTIIRSYFTLSLCIISAVTKSNLNQIIYSSLSGKCEVEDSKPRKTGLTTAQQQTKTFSKIVLKTKNILLQYYLLFWIKYYDPPPFENKRSIDRCIEFTKKILWYYQVGYYLYKKWLEFGEMLKYI